MKFSRRTVSAGLMASAASLLAPPLKAAGLAPVGGAARDLAVDDPASFNGRGRRPFSSCMKRPARCFAPAPLMN
jgi:hypothetical protein